MRIYAIKNTMWNDVLKQECGVLPILFWTHEAASKGFDNERELAADRASMNSDPDDNWSVPPQESGRADFNRDHKIVEIQLA